jgi:hypothetical protein
LSPALNASKSSRLPSKMVTGAAALPLLARYA